MSNLPRSVMAISPKPIAWAVRRVWVLLANKCKADEIDEEQGVRVYMSYVYIHISPHLHVHAPRINPFPPYS